MTVAASSLLFSAKVSEHQPKVVGGKGNILTVEFPGGERREVFDAMGGAAVAALGHGDAEILDEMGRAARESTYSYPATMTNPHAEALARFIIDKSPKGAFAAALFTCSGSETNENGMKTARQYFLEKGEDRSVFVSRRQAYHGYTVGALLLSDSFRKAPFEAITLPKTQVPKVSPCYPYRDQREGETEAAYCARLVAELEATIVAAGPHRVAAFVFEPVGGSTFGTSPAVAGYLQGARRVCDKYGVLLWLDEVMCGTGRCSATGGLHCWELWPGFAGPDLQLVGKTLGSGFVPIAGLLVSPKVHRAFVDGSNFVAGGQTYHQHAFSCRVALAVQQKIDRLQLRLQAFAHGCYLGLLLKARAAQSRMVGDVRGLGSFWLLELVRDKRTKAPWLPELGVGARVGRRCLELGMTTMAMGGTVDGCVGDHVTVAPTFVCLRGDMEHIAAVLFAAVAFVETGLYDGCV